MTTMQIETDVMATRIEMCDDFRILDSRVYQFSFSQLCDVFLSERHITLERPHLYCITMLHCKAPIHSLCTPSCDLFDIKYKMHRYLRRIKLKIKTEKRH